MTILCYHTVDPAWRCTTAVAPDVFEAQCAWLYRHRRVVELEGALHRVDRYGRLPRGYVAVTFDDGFTGVYDHALPVLQRFSIPATLFVVAATLTPDSGPVDWLDEPPAVPPQTLELDQLLELKDAGVTLGSHSWRHADLTTLDEGEAVRDLRDSRELLEDLLGQRVRLLAYPRGRHSPRVVRAARRAGYHHGFTLPEGRERPGAFTIPRVGVYPGNGTSVLRVKSAHGYLRWRTSPAYRVARSASRLIATEPQVVSS